MTTGLPIHRRKRVHLVCNAHLDPVWQWTWEDGLTEALSTFRVAAQFCEREPGFVFNHNESLLYGWVKKHDPALFRRIGKLVRRGRWHIAGGAYLQPDVNTPCGESHIRQFLLGLSFFAEHFGQRPTTAYNFDPFGHPEGFPQILAGCGMDSYIFCRPDYGTYDLPAGAFVWTDRSGARVIARRSDDHYLTRPGTDQAVERKFPRFIEHYRDEPTTMLLWGIGNHGGGPSRREWTSIGHFIREHPELEFVHSTPEAFFAELASHGTQLPVVRGEIENSFPGCYTSMSRVKRAHRHAEHLMLQTERQAALAWWFGGSAYPTPALDACWRDILFCEFHDILPGSGVPRAERDALALLGGVQDRLRRIRFDTLSKALRHERPAREGEVPVFVVNSHAFAVTQPVELDYTTGWMPANDKALRLCHAGRDVPFQRIRSDHNLTGQDVVRLVVPIELGPFEVRRLDASVVEGRPMLPRPMKIDRASLTLRSEAGVIRINPRTGLIDAVIPRGSRRSFVSPGAMRPVLFNDLDHSWTCGDPAALDEPRAWSTAPAWKRPTSRFELATPAQASEISPLAADKWRPGRSTHARPLRVVEHGQLRTTLEAIFVRDGSYLVRHYVFCRVTGRLEVRDRVVFNHKDAMLKLSIPLGFVADHSRSESLFSVVRRTPTRSYEDRHHQRWVAAVAADGAYLAVIGDGSFAHCLRPRELAVNVLRSPAYASFIIQPDDPYNDRRFVPRHDQGEHEVRYLLSFGPTLDESRLTRQAEAFHAEPFACVYYPAGHTTGHAPRHGRVGDRPPLRVDPEHVRVVAIKKAHRSDELVIRLQEQSGHATRARLRLAGRSISVHLPAFGLATVLLSRKDHQLSARTTNLVEGL